MAPSTPTPDPGSVGGGSVVGIVLAAGAGRRMGGPKALVGPLAEAGRTPLARVCSWVHEAGCGRVIAVIGAGADAVRVALAADTSWSAPDNDLASPPSWLTVVEASDWESGMGASLRVGLAAARRTPAASALITLVDLPDVRTPVYRRILALPASADTLARASYLGRPGHPVAIGRDWWDAAASAAVGDQGARSLFVRHPHRLIECGDLASGADADAPA